MAFSIIILIFPTTPAPTGTDMNYTVVVLGGWLLLCVAYYYFPKYGGVYWFTGPVANVHDEVAEKESARSVSVDEKDREAYLQE